MPRKLSVLPAVTSAVPLVPSVIDPSQILTLEEVAARLKVTPRWVYEKTRRRCQKPLPTIRIGRFLRFDWLRVSGWLNSHSTAGTK